MHGLLNALIIVAVVVFVARRFSRRRIDEGRLLVLPIVLAGVGIAQGGVIDRQHSALSAGLLVAEVVAALLLGLGLGATMRVWREADGSPWTKGTWATFGVFVTSIAVRAGLYAIGYAAGVRLGGGTIVISVAAWVLAQNAVLVWRCRELPRRVSVQA